MRILKFSFLAKFLILAGATGGLVAAALYIATNLETIDAWEALLIILLAPLCQAMVVLLYGAVGFPVYRYLARKEKLGFNEPWKKEQI